MMKSKILFLLLFFLTGVLGVYAQQLTVTGKVIDSDGWL